MGDLVPGVSWVNTPITMGYDRYPEKLIDEKKELYSTIDPKNTLFFFTHDPTYAAANIQKNEKGKWQAIHPKTQLNAYEL
jgi:hypothetical protein